jgi:uncharacterized glyoxalase superfamily protein PhnB
VIVNRSMPQVSVIPELAYRDVCEAAGWLCGAFGLRERLLIGGHRIQLVYGDGALVVIELDPAVVDIPATHALLVRVDDADAHHERAVAHGARITSPPTDYPYGERQYSALDIAGHRWTFSQSIADSDPASWGGELVDAGD